MLYALFSKYVAGGDRQHSSFTKRGPETDRQSRRLAA
jgi:hypothetical protein